MKLAVGFILYEEATARYLADFLPSLEAALGFLAEDDYRIYAHDNSTVGRSNREVIADCNSRRRSSGEAEIVYSSQAQNLGFSRAYNLMIRQAARDGAQYFFVINPDTILEPDSLKHLVAALDSDGSLGTVAPKIRRWDFEKRQKTDRIDSLGIILLPGLRFIDAEQGSEDQSGLRQEILGPSGAAGLFRMSALEKVVTYPVGNEAQYFDESFFMYKEDCDLAYRLFLSGSLSRLVPEAVIYHDRSAASAGSGPWSVWRSRSTKSRQVRSWSFYNQHLLYFKYWELQNIVGKLSIVLRVVYFFIFSLIFERFLLKEYPRLWRATRGLTNT